jgi:hypothetical protein
LGVVAYSAIFEKPFQRCWLQRKRFLALAAFSVVAYSVKKIFGVVAYSAKKYKLAIFSPKPSQFWIFWPSS